MYTKPSAPVVKTTVVAPVVKTTVVAPVAKPTTKKINNMFDDNSDDDFKPAVQQKPVE
jgi:hypothetical protein